LAPTQKKPLFLCGRPPRGIPCVGVKTHSMGPTQGAQLMGAPTQGGPHSRGPPIKGAPHKGPQLSGSHSRRPPLKSAPIKSRYSCVGNLLEVVQVPSLSGSPTKGGSTKGAPIQGGPLKIALIQSGPTKGGPTQGNHHSRGPTPNALKPFCLGDSLLESAFARGLHLWGPPFLCGPWAATPLAHA
jgi:hypothetical protein